MYFGLLHFKSSRFLHFLVSLACLSLIWMVSLPPSPSWASARPPSGSSSSPLGRPRSGSAPPSRGRVSGRAFAVKERNFFCVLSSSFVWRNEMRWKDYEVVLTRSICSAPCFVSIWAIVESPFMVARCSGDRPAMQENDYYESQIRTVHKWHNVPVWKAV